LIVSSLAFQLTSCLQFRDGKTETDKAKINYMRRLAHEYSVMVSDIRESKHLRYLDTGEKLDPREKIELTARRVGLTVPQVRFRFSLRTQISD
jgi:hypothetical protein